MIRNLGMGLMLGAVVFMALTGSGQAAETTIQANAAIKGEGRFYRATENMLLFVGFFQGAINVTQQTGDLVVNAASMVCPGTMEFDTKTKTQKGEGRCLFLTQNNDHTYATWTCTGKPGEGCEGPFTILGGTGRFATATGQGMFKMQNTIGELTITIPEGGITGDFSGKAEWTNVKVTTK
jgi:hypothetical protein